MKLIAVMFLNIFDNTSNNNIKQQIVIHNYICLLIYAYILSAFGPHALLAKLSLFLTNDMKKTK